MRIGMLTQWYPPEPGPAALPGQLAKALVQRGHEVQVVTGFPNYPDGKLQPGYRIQRRFDEVQDSVNVRRVALYANHSDSFALRLANFGSFAASATVSGISALRGCDVVWVNYSPITISIATWAHQLLHRTPVVTHVLDLWPDTLSAGGFGQGGVVGRTIDAGLSAWCSGIYKTSDSVAFISRGVGEVLQQRGVPADKLAFVPMWANEDIFLHQDAMRDRDKWGLPEDAVVLLYAGTIGAAQGIDALVDACEQISDPRFVCVIAGGGIGEASLVERLRTGRNTNVRFIGRVDPSEMPSLTKTSDASAVLLADHPLTNMTMPSKIQANLASGKPLVISAAGDAADVVREGQVGFVAAPGQPEELVSAIRAMIGAGSEGLRVMGERAKALYLSEYSLAQGTARVEELLLAAIAKKATKK